MPWEQIQGLPVVCADPQHCSVDAQGSVLLLGLASQQDVLFGKRDTHLALAGEMARSALEAIVHTQANPTPSGDGSETVHAQVPGVVSPRQEEAANGDVAVQCDPGTMAAATSLLKEGAAFSVGTVPAVDGSSAGPGNVKLYLYARETPAAAETQAVQSAGAGSEVV